MPMAFVRKKPSKKMVPVNKKNQQTKTVAKKIRKASANIIGSGVADKGTPPLFPRWFGPQTKRKQVPSPVES